MSGQSKEIVSKYQGEEELDKRYAKLGKKITDVVVHKITGIKTTDAEYWGFREVLTPEMCDVANKMKQRKPYSFEEMLKMNPQYEAADLQKILDEMTWIGVIYYDYGDNYDHDGELKDKPRVKRYIMPYLVPGAAELLNSSVDRIKAHPAVTSFFDRMAFQPLAGITQMIPQGGDGIGMHVIPVEKAINAENTSVDLEHISYWLKKYDGHIAAGICSCRACTKALNEGCGDDINDWCIQLGDLADYAVETNRAHYITKERALEILEAAEKNGFVHQITNIDGENMIFDICNCDVKICHALRTSMYFNTPNLTRSAYTAKVTKENCVACGKCVEICPAGAVKLGQRLCDKKGNEVQYEHAILPDKVRWGEYAWDPDYRDTKRMSNTYPSGSSPCKAACPAHVPVQAYIALARQGKYKEALEMIKTENPFPAVCGRVCNKRCEDACTRGKIDAPVAIDDIKKFVAELERNSEDRFVPEKVIPSLMGEWTDKIAIIGAGPAGLSCAYYLACMGYRPTVFEKNSKPGGMLTYGIPSYKLEKDVIDSEIAVLTELGVEIKCGVEVGKDVTIAQLREDGYKAFYVAIGCQGGKLPGVPGDTAKGTSIAVDYLKEALAEQKPYDGEVVVVGGGNVAVDCARTAVRLGAKAVRMVCLEARDEMPASNLEVKETLEEGIEICNSWGPKELHTDSEGKVTAVIFKRCTQVYDPGTGKFDPKYSENDTMEIPAGEVIFAIGQDIQWGSLLEGTNVKFWHGNYPVADKFTYQTDEEDIFVGGDVYTGPKFVIDAIAAGHEAAESLHRFVRPRASMTIGRDRRNYTPLNTDDITFPAYDDCGRQEAPLTGDAAKPTFKDISGILTEEQVAKEAKRCLSCGASYVDPNKCIGCGLCTTKCEFDAIHLYRDHPKCTTMRRAEDKIGGLLGYELKRCFKIMFNCGSKEAKIMRQRRKEFKKTAAERKAKEAADMAEILAKAKALREADAAASQPPAQE
ncbi:MAG: FAD-dependent oxidoreductase [Clostridia bacterium]|nr:FAD-dependent oxidoreductase [Clostridia bacterium]